VRAGWTCRTRCGSGGAVGSDRTDVEPKGTCRRRPPRSRRPTPARC
jgi:hypothetical protein